MNETRTFTEAEIGIPRKEVLEMLEIKSSTLTEWLYFLNRKEPLGWDYRPYEKEFSLSAIRVLKVFKRLVKRSRRYAIENIVSQMEEYYACTKVQRDGE
jgi:hypothetical protein